MAPEKAWITIWGVSLGDSIESSTVMIGETAVETYRTWSDNRIDFQVPPGAESGELKVIVGGISSNGLAFTVSEGALYYVDADGPQSGDEQPGNYDYPWETLAHAMEQVQPGDTVYLFSGEYNETLEPVRGGSADEPIMFKAYPGHDVYLNGEDLPGTPDGIRIDGSQYPGIGHLIFSGLNLRNFDESVHMLFGASHCNFYDLDVTLGRGGIFFYGASDAFVAQSRFHNNREFGVDLQNYSSNILIRDTTSDHNQTLDGAGFESDASVENVTLYRCNSSQNVGDGFDLRVDGLELFECQAIGNTHGIRLWKNAVVRNSIAYGNSGDGVQCQRLGAEVPTQKIINCTVAESGAAGIYVAESIDIHLQNTIAVGSNQMALFFENGADASALDHLLVHSNEGDSMGSIFWGTGDGSGVLYTPEQITSGLFAEQTAQPGAIDVIADPESLFIDYLNGDLKLKYSSKAIDFGNNTDAPEIDLERRPRLQGLTVDAGAYEFMSEISACRSDWLAYE